MKNKTKGCIAVLFAMQLFNSVSFVYFLVAWILHKATLTQVVMCIASVLFVCLPDIAQKLFRFRMASPVYIFCLVYAVCPMLGHTYGFYYFIPFWDKLLHLTGGVVFALFGAYLPKAFLKDEKVSYKLCAFSGVLFSVFVACAWEFVEFGLDSLFLTDMQKDSVITQIHSYKLGDILGGELGEILRVENVQTVINGEYYIDGYIDVGRTDTMYDLLIETAGAVVFCIAYAVDKGKHLAFHLLPKEEILPIRVEEPQLEVAVSDTEK